MYRDTRTRETIYRNHLQLKKTSSDNIRTSKPMY